MGKLVSEVNEDSGYQLQYSDFVDPTSNNSANTLNEPYERYLIFLRQFDGSSEKALKAGGWSSPPDQGPVVFAKMQEEWKEMGLKTGLEILYDYIKRDAVPLLYISLLKKHEILLLTGKDIFAEYLSISSFMFYNLIDSALAQGVEFYNLGRRLTELFRRHMTGGISWLSHRLLEVGMRLPPSRLTLPSEEEDRRSREYGRLGYSHHDEQTEEEGKVIQGIYSLDANS